MGYAPSRVYKGNGGDGSIIGQFTHADTEVLFEFSERTATDNPTWIPEFPHLVWLREIFKDGRDSRFALVKKTVAYVVVDEDADGKPVVEKWSIKKYNNYREKW